MKTFMEPEVEVKKFTVEDVITTSTQTPVPTQDPDETDLDFGN